MKLKRYDTQINVSMEHGFKAALESEATRQEMTMSEFARVAMEEKMRRCKK
jgi:hypothetical protein